MTGSWEDLPEITPEFLETALAASSVLGGSRILETGCRPIRDGRGFVGQTFRCFPLYDQPVGKSPPPASLILKLPSGNAAHRRLFGQFSLYRREVGFYQDLQLSTPLPTPACYASSYEPASGHFLLVLEDLHPARVGDRIAGLTLPQAELAVASIASMHARWWMDASLPGLDWLPTPATEHLDVPMATMYRQLWPPFARRLGDDFPKSLLLLGDSLRTSLPRVMDRLASPPWTLVHGDYQLGNLFFSTGSVEGVIDWQVSLRARGAMDVAHLLIRSLEPSNRRLGQIELLDLYHGLLCKAGVEDYPFDQLRLDYDLAVICEFGLGVVLSSMLPAPAEEAEDSGDDLRDLAEVGTLRFFSALQDLDWPAALAALSPARRWSGLRVRRPGR